jgi:AraC-like DNA-binding protein
MSSRVVRGANGIVRVDQRLCIADREIGTDVSGPAVIHAEVRVLSGTVSYIRGDTLLRAPDSFTIVLPPFSVVQAWLEQCDVIVTGAAFRPAAGSLLPATPLLLPDGVEIGRALVPNAASLAAKRLLDREYASTAVTIAAVARAAGTSASALSRAFKRSYGITPVRYRHHLRVMDALLRLAAGSAPLDVSQDVGFEDLSRFYSIFRRVACSAPGPYRPALSKNAKTALA